MVHYLMPSCMRLAGSLPCVSVCGGVPTRQGSVQAEPETTGAVPGGSIRGAAEHGGGERASKQGCMQ